MPFTEKFYLGLNSQGFHKIVYSQWGPENGKPIIFVHGLTGNGHDFDYLAPALAESGHCVIAIDLPGRGRSDFLPEPRDYNYRQYCHDLVGLLAHIGCSAAESVDWIGVSLGGLLGIRLAGLENSPIRRLILNDVGPEVPRPAIDFIHRVISQTYEFKTVQDLEKRMRETRGLTWGALTDDQWRHMARHNARTLGNGLITYRYDPGIAAVFQEEPVGEQDLWTYWDRIKCPVLVIQGGKSVILTDKILDEMKQRGPGPSMGLKVFPECGHVPSLMTKEHIQAVQEWLGTTRI